MNDESTLEIFEDYEPGLLDIDQCSHLIVLYWQDRADRNVLQSPTPWGPEVHGVFATRSPNRPNPIGLCVVELLGRDGPFLKVRAMDALEGSSLIDIKPYASEVDCVQDATIGWHEKLDLRPGELGWASHVPSDDKDGGTLDLMVKFDRKAVQDPSTLGSVEMIITGKLLIGCEL